MSLSLDSTVRATCNRRLRHSQGSVLSALFDANAFRPLRHPTCTTMIDKTLATAAEALKPLTDGATIMISGFGGSGQPNQLIDALIEHGARDLVIINNNAGNGETGIAALLKAGRVRKIVCSFPARLTRMSSMHCTKPARSRWNWCRRAIWPNAFALPGPVWARSSHPQATALELAAGKETRVIDGRPYVLEYPIRADFALIKGLLGDRWGNLTYRKAARNFGPIMAMAARVTVAQVDRVVPLGELDPEHVITPGIFVQHVIAVGDTVSRGPRPAQTAR